jgi:hypothetical protein
MALTVSRVEELRASVTGPVFLPDDREWGLRNPVLLSVSTDNTSQICYPFHCIQRERENMCEGSFLSCKHRGR